MIGFFRNEFFRFSALGVFTSLLAIHPHSIHAQEASGTISVNIDGGQRAAPISKYLYGGFIEHGGTLIYRSLWSEMIDDRKFYFPISSKVTRTAAGESARSSVPDRPAEMAPGRSRRGSRDGQGSCHLSAIKVRASNSTPQPRMEFGKRVSRLSKASSIRPYLSSRHSRQQGHRFADLGRWGG